MLPVKEKILHLKSSLTELSEVRSDVLLFLDGVSELWKGRIVLSVDEALSNVMRHGYSGCDDGDICLQMKEYTTGFVFVIIDQAQPYNPLESVSDADPDGTGGFGVGVYRKFMNAEYEISEQGGNRLTLSWEKIQDEDTVSG